MRNWIKKYLFCIHRWDSNPVTDVTTGKKEIMVTTRLFGVVISTSYEVLD
ncbi:hypothetical protein PG616_01020 [Riemerella anatipestifer]|nr:hypothetical protein [Riemerella anatipestifer]